jgi:hypothetical protein
LPSNILPPLRLVRENGEARIGIDRELFIRKSNSFVACVLAKERGGVSLEDFDWSSLTPDWNVIEEQVLRLAPPYIEGPSLVPGDDVHQ